MKLLWQADLTMGSEIWPPTMASRLEKSYQLTIHLTSPPTAQWPRIKTPKMVLCPKETISSSTLRKRKAVSLRKSNRTATSLTWMICSTQSQTRARKVIHSSPSRSMCLLSTQSSNSSRSPNRMILILSRLVKMTASLGQVSSRYRN